MGHFVGQTRIRYLGCLLLALACLSLAACNTRPPGGVKVVDQSVKRGNAPILDSQRTNSGAYTVQSGDSLYSIAFRFGWDWKELARANGIPDPYTIRVGQQIRFDGKPATTAARTVAKTSSVTTTTRQATASSSLKTTTQPARQAAPASNNPVSTPANTPVQSVKTTSGGWAWPSNGPLVGKFLATGSLNKGIDIAGSLGQPVLAASDGVVVYAGSGLRGYGELLIIKHNGTYVSAYGHNRRLLVQEGQKVKVGQTIAEMGSTGTDRVKLHFEIRRDGKPVDPLQYLPRR